MYEEPVSVVSQSDRQSDRQSGYGLPLQRMISLCANETGVLTSLGIGLVKDMAKNMGQSCDLTSRKVCISLEHPVGHASAQRLIIQHTHQVRCMELVASILIEEGEPAHRIHGALGVRQTDETIF